VNTHPGLVRYVSFSYALQKKHSRGAYTFENPRKMALLQICVPACTVFCSGIKYCEVFTLQKKFRRFYHLNETRPVLLFLLHDTKVPAQAPNLNFQFWADGLGRLFWPAGPGGRWGVRAGRRWLGSPAAAGEGVGFEVHRPIGWEDHVKKNMWHLKHKLASPWRNFVKKILNRNSAKKFNWVSSRGVRTNSVRFSFVCLF